MNQVPINSTLSLRLKRDSKETFNDAKGYLITHIYRYYQTQKNKIHILLLPVCKNKMCILFLYVYTYTKRVYEYYTCIRILGRRITLPSPHLSLWLHILRCMNLYAFMCLYACMHSLGIFTRHAYMYRFFWVIPASLCSCVKKGESPFLH